MHQDNINFQTCHMIMSLKAKTHISTIHNLWGLTPYGARKQLAMLILMHEMTSSLLADHLPPLPCILSPMNWLPQHLPIISTCFQCLHLCKDMLWPPPPHLCHHPSLHCCTPPSSSLQLSILGLLQCPLMISTHHPYTNAMIGFHMEDCSLSQFPILTLMQTYASASLLYTNIILLRPHLISCTHMLLKHYLCIYTVYSLYAFVPRPDQLCSLPCLRSHTALSHSQFTILCS
ncbi:hypothetical protein O181_099577 [Austropuccinia psidii MF-1]|uniref:Uncharacterized protein n=1 Tax=Austropuccinia psidii MF-1 TaxID=1389203 RepID=A0A9Q3JDJ5_9BASI|nr:hypothetical protein [Austropuccinia psidii MF-1]